MNLQELEAQGGIVSGELVKKKGSLKTFNEEKQELESVEFEYFVKRSSWLEYQNILSGAEDSKMNPELLAICANIRLGENGQEEIPYEVAERLDPSVVNAFREGLSEIFAKKR